MVMAVVGQRCAHNPQRMQRSSSLMMAERSAGSRFNSRVAVSSSGVSVKRSKVTQLQTYRGTDIHAAAAQNAALAVEDGVDAAIEATAGFGARLFLVVSDLDQCGRTLQALFRGECGNVQARTPLVMFFAVIVLNGVVELDFFRRDLLTA